MTEYFEGVGEDLRERLALAPRLLDWACNGELGVDEDHPRYATVTEGRDVGAMRAKYSSCADLPHWMLFREGVRAPWLNRQEHKGWRPGLNVSLLAYQAPVQCQRTPVPGQRFEPGDTLIVWNDAEGKDAHVMVVYEHAGEKLVVAEYGQPGGHIKERALHSEGFHLYVGKRRLQRWLPLAAVIGYCAENDLLVDVDLPEGL